MFLDYIESFNLMDPNGWKLWFLCRFKGFLASARSSACTALRLKILPIFLVVQDLYDLNTDEQFLKKLHGSRIRADAFAVSFFIMGGAFSEIWKSTHNGNPTLDKLDIAPCADDSKPRVPQIFILCIIY